MRRWKTVAGIVGAMIIAGGLTTVVAASPRAEAEQEGQGWCARSFDRAQRADMESFRDFDPETWREGHADDAISIFPTGQMFVGIDQIMHAAERHFRDQDAVWSWTELSRRVDGCRSAVIVYDATYDIPRFDYHQRALTVVTYVFQHGHWRSVMDQGTLLELSGA